MLKRFVRSLTLRHTHTRTNTYTQTHKLAHTHTNILYNSLFLTHSLPHTHTHAHTHRHTHKHSFSHGTHTHFLSPSNFCNTLISLRSLMYVVYRSASVMVRPLFHWLTSLLAISSADNNSPLSFPPLFARINFLHNKHRLYVC